MENRKRTYVLEWGEELGSEQKAKEEMKKRLWDWGTALDRFYRREEELKKLLEIREAQRQIQERYPEEKIHGEFLLLEQEQQKDIVRLRIDMVEILREKAQTESWLDGLTEDERRFVGMRFEKGYGFDYISVKMHLSRATLFRIQDKVLEKMMENKRKSEIV